MKKIIILVLLFSHWTAVTSDLPPMKKQAIEPNRMFPDTKFSSVDKVIQYKKKYYVLEAGNHRILVYNASMTMSHQISGIGQGRGELFYPGDFVIKNDSIFVIDGCENGLSRIQEFDLNGKCLEEIKIASKSYGFAVNSKKEILLGQPERGALISVFNWDGKQLKSFGKLRKLSDFYGPDLTDMDEQYQIAINRVNFCLDNEDNLYLSFVGAPFLQRYNKNRELVFEKRIEGLEADTIIRGFKKNRKSPIRRSIDDIPTPLINTGITVGEFNRLGVFVLAFQWKRGWLYISSLEGKRLALLEPVDRSMLYQNISISSDSVLYLPRLSVIKFNEVYQFKMSKITNKIGGD